MFSHKCIPQRRIRALAFACTRARALTRVCHWLPLQHAAAAAADRAVPHVLRRIPSLQHLDGVEGTDGLAAVAAGIGDNFAWYGFTDGSE